jgi:CheY-like chemotaxis protein
VVNSVRPDLSLLDVSLPDLDGYLTCRSLKENPETRLIPVIFRTAKIRANEARGGIDSEASGYLSKPFDPLTLHRQVLEILASSMAAENP